MVNAAEGDVKSGVFGAGGALPERRCEGTNHAATGESSSGEDAPNLVRTDF